MRPNYSYVLYLGRPYLPTMKFNRKLLPRLVHYRMPIRISKPIPNICLLLSAIKHGRP
jgi:hypothetical protein